MHSWQHVKKLKPAGELFLSPSQRFATPPLPKPLTFQSLQLLLNVLLDSEQQDPRPECGQVQVQERWCVFHSAQ